ncbi:MAG: hypothetical protein LC749_13985, partial [Actinobacteria bacterium]|nr:hypothetical protein [Actinomycetota bacterium]
PAKPDESRQVKALLTEVERLKILVAELLPDKKMPRDVAKKKQRPDKTLNDGRGGNMLPGA